MNSNHMTKAITRQGQIPKGIKVIKVFISKRLTINSLLYPDC